MKKIEAIVRQEKFQDVNAALEKSGIGGMTIVEAKGFGQRRQGLDHRVVKIEIYVDEFQVDKIIDIIRKVAKTGTKGDGMIAVVDLIRLYRIRTGEEGANAI